MLQSTRTFRLDKNVDLSLQKHHFVICHALIAGPKTSFVELDPDPLYL